MCSVLPSNFLEISILVRAGPKHTICWLYLITLLSPTKFHLFFEAAVRAPPRVLGEQMMYENALD